MIRSAIIQQFRDENKEIPSRIIGDTVLNGWLLTGDKIFCAVTRCIVDEGTFNSAISSSVYLTRYDLTILITKFYDIDEYPGGGVIYDDDPMTKTTIAELDAESPNWRSRTAGTPKKWYRRGKYLYFDRPVSEVKTIRVYSVLISDDWNADVAPYNQLTFMEPYHDGMVKYIDWKAKAHINKEVEAAQARKEFLDYAAWVKKTLGGTKFGNIRFVPKSGVYQPEN